MAKLLLLLILSLYPSIISLSCRVSHSSAALHHPHSGVRWNRELHSPSTRWQLRGGSDDGSVQHWDAPASLNTTAAMLADMDGGSLEPG